jgi:hypothetical protein
MEIKKVKAVTFKPFVSYKDVREAFGLEESKSDFVNSRLTSKMIIEVDTNEGTKYINKNVYLYKDSLIVPVRVDDGYKLSTVGKIEDGTLNFNIFVGKNLVLEGKNIKIKHAKEPRYLNINANDKNQLDYFNSKISSEVDENFSHSFKIVSYAFTNEATFELKSADSISKVKQGAKKGKFVKKASPAKEAVKEEEVNLEQEEISLDDLENM